MVQTKRILSLCGFSGTGKTIIGEAFAQKYRDKFTFIDLDAHIEQRQGVTINQIFSELGEDYFRRWEYETFDQLTSITDKNLIVSLGAGALSSPLSKLSRLVSQKSVVVYLKSSIEVLINRLSDDKEIAKRPLIKSIFSEVDTHCNKIENLNDLQKKKLLSDWIIKTLSQREPQYLKIAEYKIDTSVWDEEFILSQLTRIARSQALL